MLVGAIALAGALSVQGASAQRSEPSEPVDPMEVILRSLQVDFLCSNNYTGVDRLGKSMSIMQLIQSFQNGQIQSLEYFSAQCQRHETPRLTLSLNPVALMQLQFAGPIEIPQ